MKKILIFLLIALAALSCKSDRKKSILPAGLRGAEEEIKAEVRGLPPVVAQHEIFELCRANTLCRFSKVAKEWEIEGYDQIIISQDRNSNTAFFFLKKGFEYDFPSKTVKQKGKIIGSFDYTVPDSFKLIGIN